MLDCMLNYKLNQLLMITMYNGLSLMPRAGNTRLRRASRLCASALGIFIATMTLSPHHVAAYAAALEGGAGDAADPYLWLEDVSGSRAMEWVKAQNAKTNKVLESDPRYQSLLDDAKSFEMAEDRIPEPHVLGGKIYNFWQNSAHQHGIWRETTLDDYQIASPGWRTILDLDLLSSAERGNWFWKGAVCREPAENRCIVSLSDGGEDAVTLREFDLKLGRFVEGGFSLPRSKQDLAWEGPIPCWSPANGHPEKSLNPDMRSSSNASSVVSRCPRRLRCFAERRTTSVWLRPHSMTAPGITSS